MDSLASWAKKKMSSNLWCHGENQPQRLDLSCTISDFSFDLRVNVVWHFKGTVCTVILRCCKPKSDQKCRSYVTLKHQWILNLQFDHFFRGLKRGVFDKIRCSQWLQGMVLDGLEWFKAKNRKSMTFNYKSAVRYLVLAPLPKQVREYSRFCYFRPAGVLPDALYQTYGSTPTSLV